MLLLKCKSLSFKRTPETFAQNINVSSHYVNTVERLLNDCNVNGDNNCCQRLSDVYNDYVTMSYQRKYYEAFLPLKCENIFVFCLLDFFLEKFKICNAVFAHSKLSLLNGSSRSLFVAFVHSRSFCGKKNSKI